VSLSPSLTKLAVTPFLPAIYGVIHAVIDASCALCLFSSIRIHRVPSQQAFYLVVGYDLLAFAGQAILGWAVDKWRVPRAAIFTGIVATALAVVTGRFEPIATVLLAGIGNALFHLGAGAFSIYTNFGRATPAGIFVAPGALGLAFGTWMGKSDAPVAWPFGLALAISLIIALALKNPHIPYREQATEIHVDYPLLITLLLLFSIAIRSFVGFAGCYQCEKVKTILFGMPLVAFAGKALGGIVSDRIGWIKTGVGALLLSAPIIAFGNAVPLAMIGGMLLFQMTMPVTLVATVRLFPRKPAFAFGLTCLALSVGALPTFFSAVKRTYNHYAIFTLILVSAGVLYLALRLFKGKIPMIYGREAAILSQ
jgi:FSR family fosmidomycin resistance protein-like MFS transporter